MAGYSEQRDAAGRVTIVVKDTQIWWLAVYALAIFLVFIGFETVASGEYPKKFGTFREGPCDKLLARINAALRH